jgi:phosphatidylinositol-3-phosphatase
VPHFSHVVVIVFENKEYGEVIGSSQAPSFNRVARSGALLTNYCGVAHPSLPNYLALVSGSTHGISDNCTDCPVDGRNLADTLEQAGLTWKTYAEGLPAPGFSGAHAGRYAKKHNPFVYFRDVSSNRRRLARIVPLSQLGRDLVARALPSFALVIPDLCHDMHDCSVADGDRWLQTFLPPPLKNRQLRHSVVFIVFDEGSGRDNSGGGGHTVALAAGPTVKPGSKSSAGLTHYNLLRTIEEGLRLPPLGQSRPARPIAGIWR